MSRFREKIFADKQPAKVVVPAQVVEPQPMKQIKKEVKSKTKKNGNH